MHPSCSMCGRRLELEELLGSICGRCDKIMGDFEAEMAMVAGSVGR